MKTWKAQAKMFSFSAVLDWARGRAEALSPEIHVIPSLTLLSTETMLGWATEGIWNRLLLRIGSLKCNQRFWEFREGDEEYIPILCLRRWTFASEFS